MFPSLLSVVLYATPANVHRVIVKDLQGRQEEFFCFVLLKLPDNEKKKKDINTKYKRLDFVDSFVLEVKFILSASNFSSD